MIKKYSMECHPKIASDCPKKGESFDNEDDAQDWVENECWIFSGEGWICPKCHDEFMSSLTSHRHVQGNGIDGMDSEIEAHDGLDNDLESGIDIVR